MVWIFKPHFLELVFWVDLTHLFKFLYKGIMSFDISLWAIFFLDCVDLDIVRKGKDKVLAGFLLVKASEFLNHVKAYRIV